MNASTNTNMSKPLLSTPPGFPRIPADAFTGAIFTLLGVAVVVAAGRLYLRWRSLRNFGVDDGFLIVAVFLYITETGVLNKLRDLSYLQMRVDMGVEIPPSDFGEQMDSYANLDLSVSILVWSSIFCIKFSFMTFFLPLMSRVRGIKIWWWIAMALMIPSALVSILLGVWVQQASKVAIDQDIITDIIKREAVYLRVTTGLDIFTDLLVISIPICLLWNVKIDLKRKLALGTVLCLSLFMIIIAVIRLVLTPIKSPTGDTIPDSIWLFFWQSMESCIAIIMVSLTAFRSLYGQERSKHSGKGYGQVISSERSGHVEKKSPSSAAFGGPNKASAVSRTEERGAYKGSRKSAWDREEEEIMMMGDLHTRPVSDISRDERQRLSAGSPLPVRPFV